MLSTLPNGKLIYKIPSFVKRMVYHLTQEILLYQKTYQPHLHNTFFNFDDYVLDLSGEENRLNGDTVNTIYTELFIFIDSTGVLETINEIR